MPLFVAGRLLASVPSSDGPHALAIPSQPGKRRQPKTSIFWGQDNIFFTAAGGEAYLKDLTARESFVFTPATLSWETISALFRSTDTARRVLYRPLRANQNWDGVP